MFCSVTVKLMPAGTLKMTSYYMVQRWHDWYCNSYLHSNILWQVSWVDTFSDEAQLHGTFIIHLKNKWACQKHQGKHGQDGHCYISVMGDHLGLNNRKLEMWAAAIVSWFLLLFHLHLYWHHFHRLLGMLQNMNLPIPLTSTVFVMAVFLTQSLKATQDHVLLLQMTPQPFSWLLSSRSSPATLLQSPLHQWRPQLPPPTTPSRKAAVTIPFSPAPDPGLELHACLGDFLHSKGIDLTGTEVALMELKLTPDIVSKVPVARLCEVMGAVEGWVCKFQVFCQEWSARLEDKKWK